MEKKSGKMEPRRVPEGVKNGVKTSMKKYAKESGKIMNFRSPEGRAKSTPAAPLMQVICMERKTTQKKKPEDAPQHGTTPRALRPGADFGTFWGGLGSHFGSQRATNMGSNFDNKN